MNEFDPEHKKSRRKITDTQVRELKELYHEQKWTQKELADKFGISVMQVGRIVRGDSRKSVQIASELIEEQAKKQMEEMKKMLEGQARLFAGGVFENGNLRITTPEPWKPGFYEGIPVSDEVKAKAAAFGARERPPRPADRPLPQGITHIPDAFEQEPPAEESGTEDVLERMQRDIAAQRKKNTAGNEMLDELKELK